MKIKLKLLTLLSTCFFGYAQTSIKPLKVQKGELIFSDDFERKHIGNQWIIKEKFNGAFQISDGSLKGKELKDAGHGSVARAHFSSSDVIIEFDVKFDGVKRFNLVLDDSLCKTVWAGHISRVSFTQNDFRVQDDKTGSMDLKLRKERLKHPENIEEINALLKTKMDIAKFKFNKGKWYHVVITKQGTVLECRIGNVIAQINSEGIGHPNLNKFGPTITGGDVLFDNFKIWAIK